MCFISIYGILNTLSEYTYFFISKNITSYTCSLWKKKTKTKTKSKTKQQQQQKTCTVALVYGENRF